MDLQARARLISASKPPPSRAELRRFGAIVGALFLLFALIPLARHRPMPLWPCFIGGPLLVLGLVVPRALAIVHAGWMLLGRALGWLQLRILLTVVYLLVLTPIGLLRRLLGRDSFGRAPQAGSHRTPSRASAREEMERPY